MKWRVQLVISDEEHGIRHLRPLIEVAEVEGETPWEALVAAAEVFKERKVGIGRLDTARFRFQRL